MTEKLKGQIVNECWEATPSEKLKRNGWTVTVPVTVYPDGNGLNVEVGESLIVTVDGIEYECRCRGWNLARPLSDTERKYYVKTDLIMERAWDGYRAPIEDTQIIITRREAIVRGLIK